MAWYIYARILQQPIRNSGVNLTKYYAQMKDFTGILQQMKKYDLVNLNSVNPCYAEHSSKYCGHAYHKLCTKNMAHTIVTNSAVGLAAAQIVDYHRLCFQIEFDFRDAKLHLGLEDFMNITPTAVNNAANLAMCMINVNEI